MDGSPTPQETERDPGSEPRSSARPLPDTEPRVDADLADDVVRRLSGREGSFGRYQLRGEIARGGQGVILRVWDTDLRRDLAMKVVVDPTERSGGGGVPTTDAKTLGRFLEEAQVTGQLDHPGIVPVHELGLDDQGRVYFTMKLVRGRELAQIFELVRGQKEGWTLTRALGLMLKVCEAMSYAHFKGVIHRDLKPANVMVGRFGAVYVMDWGIARLLGQEDHKDIRLRAESLPMTLEVQSERRERAGDPAASPLLTMDGDVIGTPAYMAPEQALGRLGEVGPQADVYSVGAMLYHLLSGQVPYVPAGAVMNNYLVLARVMEEPPRPLGQLAPELPGELVAICEKAMAREPSQRYASMSALAEDLQAFLEGRVVKAYGGGALAEARKWVRRNKALASSLAAAGVLLVGGLAAVGSVQAAGRRAADEQRRLAEASARLATERAEDVLRLSALQELDDLVAEADGLWPSVPEHVEAYEQWLARARALVAERPRHREKREEIRGRALSGGSGGHWSFGAKEDSWWHAQLSKLIDGLEGLADPATGLIAGHSPAHGWGVERRLAFARNLEERTVRGPDAARRWAEALASISDPAQCPSYDGLALSPELGLLPIGRDPSSGLWEFWHVASGAEPARGDDGTLALTEETGIVLVLIPGGSFWMGAQSQDPGGRNYHPGALVEEGPVHEVRLSPFFLSKYELTQAQWKRFVLSNPSYYGRDGDWVAGEWSRTETWPSLLHPVEQISWDESAEVLRRMGLSLPSEACWEYAARAGTATPWWTGAKPHSLSGAANLSDAWRSSHGGAVGWDYEDWDDGNTVHAPVGSYRANGFGLHDVIGNVWEWCLDGYDSAFYGASPSLDPIGGRGAKKRIFRGGSFYDPAVDARSSDRNSNAPEGGYDDIGVRPAREITAR